MATNLKDVVVALLGIKTTEIVSCPIVPVQVPGVVAAAYTANDCVGTVLKLAVPKRGIIVSASFWDLSDLNVQYDLEIFNRSITVAGDNAAWSPSDDDMLKWIDEIPFFTNEDQINSRSYSVRNWGKAYTAPEGFFYIQVLDRSAGTIVAANLPKLQLQIQSYDSSFQES